MKYVNIVVELKKRVIINLECNDSKSKEGEREREREEEEARGRIINYLRKIDSITKMLIRRI